MKVNKSNILEEDDNPIYVWTFEQPADKGRHHQSTLVCHILEKLILFWKEREVLEMFEASYTVTLTGDLLMDS